MVICVTNRKLCKDDFLTRIDLIAKGKPYAILLREKDLSTTEYERLARSVRQICLDHQVPLIISQNIDAAAEMQCPSIHLSMEGIKKYQNKIKPFPRVGVSVHSISEAEEAQRLGAAYLIAGHIFATESKKGVPPRGLSFLKEVCDSVNIPVFAIGGITKDKVKAVIDVGAKGVCVMSEAMTCSRPDELGSSFRA
jgi:thiamine-phosphate pyrophosphorylase